MNVIATGLAERGLHVLRFEFPYMVERRKSGKKRPPNGQGLLLDAWRQVTELVTELVTAQIADPARLVIGGKSMGGRMASLLADELAVSGMVCLGYPFHPPGRPEKLRTDHLARLKTPTLIVQGERDTFGSREEVGGYNLSKRIRMAWMPDGDHSFKPRVKSGETLQRNLEICCDAVTEFIREI